MQIKPTSMSIPHATLFVMFKTPALLEVTINFIYGYNDTPLCNILGK